MPDIFVTSDAILPFVNSYRHILQTNSPLEKDELDVIACFGKIVDCPDILEEITETFQIGFWSK
jgi:hypothetical protein